MLTLVDSEFSASSPVLIVMISMFHANFVTTSFGQGSSLGNKTTANFF
jgi:hypothetical protein